MFLNGFGTAVPGHRYRQSDCWAALQGTPDLDRLAPRSQALLRKVLLGANGIETRHLALDSLAEAFRLDPDTLHERFLRHAPDLATTAARRALEDARMSAEDVDALLVATCTGYLCPGLTSHVSERLGLRNSVEFLDLVGLGCGAAIPTLRTAANWLAAGTTRTVLSVCVEVSSAAMYLDDDPGVLISACLFGDGAAAVVSAARPVDHRRRVQWRHAASRLHPEARSALCFESRGGRLRNILTPAVPALAASHVGQLADSMFHQAGIHQSDIHEWILHPGGREVLVALRGRLGLEEKEVRHSAAVLRDFGNLSSPCVLFALRDALANGAPGGWWLLSSFGAGFSCHGALLEVS